MQGDKKIGLAMSLLLIGAVAAFFFRDEEFYPRTAPPLADPETLDRQLAETTDSLYPPPPKPELNESVPFSQKLLEAPEWSQRPPAEPPGEPIPFSGPNVPVPDSIFERSPTSGLPGDPSGQYKIYTVQNGDTLSGIAYQFLGRSSRFNEIFAANQDKLRTADDLRVGMQIRIPVAGAAPIKPVATPNPPTPRTQPARVTQAPVDPREREPFTRSPELPATQPPQRTPAPETPKQPQTPAELGFHVRRPRHVPPQPATSEVQPQPTVPNYQGDPLPPQRPQSSAIPTPGPPLVPSPTQSLNTFDEGSNAVPFESSPTKTEPQTSLRKSELRKAEVAGRRETPELPAAPRLYQVRTGDTLESIAIEFYGSPQAVRKIFQENRRLLQQPGPLQVGSSLRLPPQ